jgi:hypothetical protein
MIHGILDVCVSTGPHAYKVTESDRKIAFVGRVSWRISSQAADELGRRPAHHQSEDFYCTGKK